VFGIVDGSGWTDKTVTLDDSTCVISQNLGYTVFSTVGAFYLPLASCTWPGLIYNSIHRIVSHIVRPHHLLSIIYLATPYLGSISYLPLASFTWLHHTWLPDLPGLHYLPGWHHLPASSIIYLAISYPYLDSIIYLPVTRLTPASNIIYLTTSY